MNEGHRVGEPGEEGGLLDRGVTAADDSDVLAGEEEPVTGGAPGHATTRQTDLVLETELAVGRSRGEDHRAGVVSVSIGVDDLLDLTGEVNLGDIVSDELGLESHSLGAHLSHEIRTHDALGEAGVVLDLGGLHEGATGIHGSLEDERLQPCAGGVNGCGVSSRTGTDDDDVTGLVVASGVGVNGLGGRLNGVGLRGIGQRDVAEDGVGHEGLSCHGVSWSVTGSGINLSSTQRVQDIPGGD